jgi:hypothetical protein
MASPFKAVSADFRLVCVFGLEGPPNYRPPENRGAKSLNVYFYRFSYRILMASTFLAFSAHFRLVERLG